MKTITHVQSSSIENLLAAVAINYDVLRDPGEPADTKILARQWICAIQKELNARGHFGPKLLEEKHCGCGKVHTHAGLAVSWIDPEGPEEGCSGYHWDCSCGTSLFVPFRCVKE